MRPWWCARRSPGAGCEAPLGATGDLRLRHGRGWRARDYELFRAPSLPLPRSPVRALNGCAWRAGCSPRARHYSRGRRPVTGHWPRRRRCIGVRLGFSQRTRRSARAASPMVRTAWTRRQCTSTRTSWARARFTRFAVGLPHNVSVEISTSRGDTGRTIRCVHALAPAHRRLQGPRWGYESSFTKSAWQAVDQYDHITLACPPSLVPGHPLNEAPQPVTCTTPSMAPPAAWLPVELDVGGASIRPTAEPRASARHRARGAIGDPF